MTAPGECDVEVWLERAPGPRSLGHIGTACRVGGVELGLGLERTRSRGERAAWLASPQVKWASDPDRAVAIGLVATLGLRSHDPRRGAALLVPVTWRPNDALALHANVGRDWSSGEPARTRRGVSVEWMPQASWLAVAEWFHDGTGSSSRIGMRWFASKQSSFDLSVAETGIWTLGWNRSFRLPD